MDIDHGTIVSVAFARQNYVPSIDAPSGVVADAMSSKSRRDG